MGTRTVPSNSNPRKLRRKHSNAIVETGCESVTDAITSREELQAGPWEPAEKPVPWLFGCRLDFEASDGRAMSVRRKRRQPCRFWAGRDRPGFRFHLPG